MRYLYLNDTDERAEAAQPETAQQAVMAGYATFTEEVRPRGTLVIDEALHPTATAMTVRVRDGKSGRPAGNWG